MLVMARRNVRRLTRLVYTLMDVSRLEAGRLKATFRPANLGVVTRDLAGLFRGAIERAKLRYIVECDLTPRNVYVDPDHWEKLVFNLIGNALKYTMRGFVHVTLSYEQSGVLLSVKDSGVGIPISDLGLVGERFHRVQSVSRSHEGTGIGLALIKELIKMHGGVLEIDSSTTSESMDGSHGSTFRVRIPLGSDHLQPTPSIENFTEQARKRPIAKASSTRPCNGTRIGRPAASIRLAILDCTPAIRLVRARGVWIRAPCTSRMRTSYCLLMTLLTLDDTCGRSSPPSAHLSRRETDKRPSTFANRGPRFLSFQT